MATIYGESGAWADVAASLTAENLFVSHPRELKPLLEAHKNQHGLGLAPLQERFEREIDELSERCKILIEGFPANLAAATKTLNMELAHIETERNQFRSRAFLRNLLTGFVPLFLMAHHQRRLEHKKAEAINRLHHDIQKLQTDCLYRQSSRERLIQQRYNKITENISLIEKTLKSQELAGALAELDVIECLKLLPDEYRVCNDVRLKAARKIRFDGEYLLSAQIDHLVVGPTGIFVLEVKRWNKKFVNQQNYFDPFQQVARASYLCYDTLRYVFPGNRVRSMIVNCGVLPPCSQNHRVKVVTLSELRGYITWRHQPSLNNEDVAGVVKLLRH